MEYIYIYHAAVYVCRNSSSSYILINCKLTSISYHVKSIIENPWCSTRDRYTIDSGVVWPVEWSGVVWPVECSGVEWSGALSTIYGYTLRLLIT